MFLNERMENEGSLDDILLFAAEKAGIIQSEIVLKKLTLGNREDAEEYLADIRKGNETVAVRYTVVNSNFEETEKARELLQKLADAEKVESRYESAFERFKNQTSMKKTCEECKSSISREYFVKKVEDALLNAAQTEGADVSLTPLDPEKLIACPVCGNKEFLLTEGDRQKEEKQAEKIHSITIKMDEEREKYNIKHAETIVYLLILTDDITPPKVEAEEEEQVIGFETQL